MTAEKDAYSSDTLERSNLSSLQSDLSSVKKDTRPSDTKIEILKCYCQQHALGNIKFVACPAVNPNNESSAFASGRQCFCQRPQLNGYEQKSELDDSKDFTTNENKNADWQRFNWKWPRQSYTSKKDKSYEAKSKNRRHSRNEKPCYEVSEGIPGKKTYGLKNLIENPMKHKTYLEDEAEKPEKIEIYYFDHGNSAYYHTTDVPPVLTTEVTSEKITVAATRFWAEIFGYVHLVTSFLTALFLQFLRFLLFSIVRPLTIGTIQLVADYFVKPLLSITFNGLIQPILILMYNIATSFRDFCEPIATALGFFIREFAVLFASCRLIEVHNYNNYNNNRANNGNT